MTQYDYKVVPAPRRAKKMRGIRGAEELFAHTLTDAINEVARQGWEYVRAERLPAEAPRGWFRSGAAGEQTVLVFRRAREGMGPRIAASHEPETDVAPVAHVPAGACGATPRRATASRRCGSSRCRQRGGRPLPDPAAPAAPLGPVDQG